MVTTNVQISSLFGNEVQYVIPLFQRHYVWDMEVQWEPLWEDLMEKADQRLSKNRRQQFTHFTGAIVIQQKQTNVNEVQKYEIIDGQQRLTTFQIILCALRDVCKSYEFDEIEAQADRNILNQGYLLYDLPDDRYKLMPTEFDRNSFISLADRRVDDSNGRIHSTYNYFRGEIEGYVERDRGKMLALFNSILNDFSLVQILLDPHDQPERIFESLNARGKPLFQFDLLRNNLFLRARIEEDRDALYRNYWKHFENSYWETEVRVGKTKMTLSERFFQHFLTAKLGEENVTPLFSVYQKRLVENEGIRNQLSELKKYSKVYHEMTACSPDSEIGRAMLFYKTFDIATFYPLILFVINELEVSGPNLTKVLEIMESYTMRRLVCFKGGVRSYTKLICKLIQNLKGKHFDLGNFIELLSAETSKSTKWPTDSEVNTFLTFGWHSSNINRNVIRYILYRIELMKRIENRFLETNQLFFDSELSLEHIMPEAWKKTWSLPTGSDGKSFSDGQIYYEDLFSLQEKENNPDWETEPSVEGLASDSYQSQFLIARERNGNLQNIGNLTLVTSKLNSKLSNSPFTEKRVALGENSVLMLNKEICEHRTWDLKQIQDRANELITIFCKIWPPAKDFAKNFPYHLDQPVDIPPHSEQDYPQQDESLSADLHSSENHNEVVLSQQHDRDMRLKTPESDKVPNGNWKKSKKSTTYTVGGQQHTIQCSIGQILYRREQGLTWSEVADTLGIEQYHLTDSTKLRSSSEWKRAIASKKREN